MEPVSGETLAGKYRLVRELGRGGMGSVWVAEHVTLKSPVAIKIIQPAVAADPMALARFLREAQAAASLRSPHVVQILDHGVDNGTPFIAMELMEGEPLSARLERQGKLSPAETSRYVTHIARAIGRAHAAGIVHRDLKPDNVFLVRNDDEEVAKVLDFGIAKANLFGGSAGTATVTGTLLGTPYYMSPEQTGASSLVDHRTDIWALGVITCECLTGRRPFEGETLTRLLLAICERPMPQPSRIAPVPVGFDAWFARACAREPAHRFESAKDAAMALREICEGHGSMISPATGGGNFQETALGQWPTGSSSFNGHLPSASGLSATLDRDDAHPFQRRGRTLMVLGVSVPLVALIGMGLFLWSRSGPDTTAHTAVPTASVVAAAPPKPADAPSVDVRPVQPTELPEVAPKVADDPAFAGSNDLIERNAYGTEPTAIAEPRVTTRPRSGKTKQQPKQGAAASTSPASSEAAPRPKPRPRQDDEDLGI
jgi:serine/threonine-protein kinase